MARIAVRELQVGTQLSMDVVDNSGRVLLEAGTIIQKKHFQIFKAWGIRTVQIESDDGPAVEPTAEHLSQGLEHANSLLRLNEENHELIQMLRLLIQRRYATKLAEKEQQ